jgi:hypothetical protein
MIEAKHHHQPNACAGATLIETLMYIGLFGLVVTGVVASAYVLIETSDRNQTKVLLEEESAFLLAKIALAMDGVASVATPSANASAPVFMATRFDGSAVALALSGDALTLGGVPLNNDDVAVRRLTFIRTVDASNPSSPERIDCGVEVRARTNTGAILERSATTTRYLRK